MAYKYVTETERRATALKVALVLLEQYPDKGAGDALWALDILERTGVELTYEQTVAVNWYTGAAPNQIRLFTREWRQQSQRQQLAAISKKEVA